MIVDGKALAENIKEILREEIEELGKKLTMAIVLVGDDRASLSYIDKKMEVAEELGVAVRLVRLPISISEKELLAEIGKLNNDQALDGIIVQLPLPKDINSQVILEAVSPFKDIDALGKKSEVFSPIVVSVEAILGAYDVELAGKKTVVLGKGKLVGQPLVAWLAKQNIDPVVVDRETNQAELFKIIKEAEVLFLGIGQPNFIKPDMISPGVVIIDAGTSEESGKLAGDADQACAELASVFTPVPGGIGPLTVVSLFANLTSLAYQAKSR